MNVTTFGLLLRHLLLGIANSMPRYHSVDHARVRLYRLAGLKLGKGVRIAGPLIVDLSLRKNTLTTISVGEDTYINFNVRISSNDSSVQIGGNCLIGPNVVFETTGHSFMPGDTWSRFTRAIVVNDNVWIGVGATILAGVKIGRNCIVAAGAVVTSDVEPYTLVGGVPAKFIKTIEPWNP